MLSAVLITPQQGELSGLRAKADLFPCLQREDPAYLVQVDSQTIISRSDGQAPHISTLHVSGLMEPRH
eukprot:1157754-Pelagomonas_calceolata.AAC.2